MKPFVLILTAWLAACDVGVYESQTCDTSECVTLLEIPLPEGVGQGAELVLADGEIVGVECLANSPCRQAGLAWTPADGKPKLRGITLRAGDQAWRVNPGPAVVERMCAWDCTIRYQATLEPL
jgi:hypothetical protein